MNTLIRLFACVVPALLIGWIGLLLLEWWGLAWGAFGFLWFWNLTSGEA
jgi:hypothetical protein